MLEVNAHHLQGSARRRQNLESTDGIKVVKTFDSSVFSGASIETDTYNLDSLSALPDVAKVWPNQVIHLDPIEPQAVPIEDAPNYTTHNATGVSKLHAEGIFGQGVKVGIVDTGVWYYHPAVSFCRATPFNLKFVNKWSSLAAGLVLASRLQVATTLLATDV